MVKIIGLADFENFLREVADMVEARSPTEAVVPLATAYGLESGDVEWLPDVISATGCSDHQGCEGVGSRRSDAGAVPRLQLSPAVQVNEGELPKLRSPSWCRMPHRWIGRPRTKGVADRHGGDSAHIPLQVLPACDRRCSARRRQHT
jgi:hypothetical protein